MTTPGGVPNLPVGALTLDTLASKTQDMSPSGMRGRTDERVSSIFGSSTGGDITSDLSPFGIIAAIFAGFNSVVANADPADITGPEDLPGLLLDFIESLPFVGQFVGLLEAILGTYTGDDTTLLTVQEIFAPIRAVAEAFPGLINSLVNGGQPINVLNLFGQLTQGLFGVVPASSISSNNPNLLNNGGFDGSISMDGSGVWTYDATTGHTSNGSAMTTADGTLKALLSNAVDVTVGQKLTPTVWVKSSGYAGTGTPIRLAVKTYLAGAAVSGTNIASSAGPGGTWTQMSGTYTVPSGVDSVRLRLVVDTTATGGTIWFDDGSLTKPGNGPFDGILQLFGLTSLEDLFSGLDINAIWSAIITAIMNPLGLLEDAIGRGDLSATIAAIFGALTGGGTVTNPLTDLENAFQQIPFLNVLGIGGPADIGSSVQSTWDQWISGLVGVLGTGAGLADIFNVGQQVSSQAALGGFSWDILGIRNNKSLKTGFLPSSQSNIGLDKIAIASVAPTLAVTATTALTAYERISESMSLGAVSWQGYGVTSVTSCVVNIYKMDTATGLDTLVYTSPNIVGSLAGGSSPVPVVHSLTSPIAVGPGEVYGFEICVRGAGTHNVAGATSWLADQTTYPLRWASRRDSSTTLSPSTRTPSYSGDVMFFEYAVAASGVVIPHSPTTMLFNTVSTPTLPVPSWANTVQIIEVGNGGGGHEGGTYGISGCGGAAGVWNTTTWTRGTDWLATATPILAFAIPAAARGGDSSTGTVNGANGGSVTATLPATTGHSAVTLTATGGAGATAYFTGSGSANDGVSPGPHDYDGITYAGAPTQTTFGAVGGNPGTGGAGGNWVSFQSGGNGGLGAVWVRFKQ